MHALQPVFPSRQALLWIKAIDAIPFLGEIQGVPPWHAPGSTPRMREPLRFCQITLAPPQRFFGLLAFTALCMQRLVSCLEILNCMFQVVTRVSKRFFGSHLRDTHQCNKKVRKEDGEEGWHLAKSWDQRMPMLISERKSREH